ncbi:MAG: branched-chain amino acid ABC transporter permease [Chloroflexi bacterium]|nr:branched-chain amino acid ABC transporter permease [Chloroflexota bacterium]
MQTDVLLSAVSVGVIRGGMYALMAIGLTLILGVMHVYNFAHGDLYMLGAYWGYFATVTFGFPPLLAFVFAALVGFIVGAVIDKVLLHPLRQRSREEWVLNTFLVMAGLSFVIQNVVRLVFGNKFRGIASYFEGTVQFLNVSVSVDRLVALLVAGVVIIALWQFMARTSTGRAIRAVADDEKGAKLVGINLNNIHTLTFALSSMLAAIAGATMLSINPAFPATGTRVNAASWYVVMLVGLGNVGGSIIGAFIIGILESLAFFLVGEGWPEVINLLVIALILVVKPNGLFGSQVKSRI